MAPQDDLTAERAAALLEKCMKMGWAFNGSYTEGQGHYVLAQALKTARQEALREKARQAQLLAAPCMWCDYKGPGYYQAFTHEIDCPWHAIGGLNERMEQLDRLASEGG